MTTSIEPGYPQAPRRQLFVDEDEPAPSGNGPNRVGWVTPLALLGGVALTVLLTRGGSHFLFLPIILPFGLGGGRFLRRAFAPLRAKRVLALGEQELSLVTLSRLGARARSPIRSIRTDDGVFVAIVPSRVWVNGVENVEVRIIGADGVIPLGVEGADVARRLRHRLVTMLSQAGIRALDADASLQGATEVRRDGSGLHIEWQSGGARPGGSGILGPLVRSAFGGGVRRTVLDSSRAGWSLQVKSGGRTLASTGGPGMLEARLVTTEDPDPFGTGLVTHRRVLELRAAGEVVGTVGADLSEPELRWVCEHLSPP